MATWKPSEWGLIRIGYIVARAEYVDAWQAYIVEQEFNAQLTLRERVVCTLLDME